MGSWENRELITVGDAVCVVLGRIWTDDPKSDDAQDEGRGKENADKGIAGHLAVLQRDTASAANAAKNKDGDHEPAKRVPVGDVEIGGDERARAIDGERDDRSGDKENKDLVHHTTSPEVGARMIRNAPPRGAEGTGVMASGKRMNTGKVVAPNGRKPMNAGVTGHTPEFVH